MYECIHSDKDQPEQEHTDFEIGGHHTRYKNPPTPVMNNRYEDNPI